MKQIKHRFYGLYLIIVASFVFLMYFILTNVVEEKIENSQREQLNKEVVALTEYVDEQMQAAESTYTSAEVIAVLEDISPVVHERITFLTVEGDPIYDSVMDVSNLTNLFNFTEIQQVLAGEVIGVAVRESSQSDYPNYYVAQAVYDEDGEPVGILRVSNEIRDLTDAMRTSFTIQIAGVIVFAFLIVLLSNNWMNRVTNALSDMKSVVMRLANTQYDARYTAQSFNEIDDLGFYVNDLAYNLNEQHQQLKSSEKRIFGLINHLIVGVMLLDDERRIQIVNPIMNELLGTNLYGKISHLYTDYVKSAELIELIERAYHKREAVNDEIVIYYPEEKILDANIVPVPGRNPGERNYIVLLYDITEIRRLEQVRTDFATNVSHELRTPITALKGFSETLLDGAMHDEEVLQEFLEIMLTESTRLEAMVQEILQLSQLEQRNVHRSTEQVPVRDVAYKVIQILHQKIEMKNMSVTIEEISKKLTVQVNRDQLKQVLMNLIANAISYTPESGKVLVKIEQAGNEAKIQVMDNGIGIPKQDQARIFERFYRVDKARSRNSGGTGLGLSIVKWVVDSMDGRIEVDSEVNVGTTFTVWLPLEK